MIKLENITMEFQGRQILQDISFEVAPGETLVIIGPSGSGKSTLLRLIIGLLKPTTGHVWVKGQEISQWSEEQLDVLRIHMGMVFQYSALFDSMSVGENVAFGLRQHTQMSEDEISQVVKNKLRVVGLVGKEDLMPNQLSGGMKKRVSLARAIAVNPEILLYDEPTAGLDPIMSSKIDRLMMATRRRMGVTSIVVTHHMSSAFRVADRIAMIHNGRIVEIATVEEFQRSDNPLVQQFIHGVRRPDLFARRRARECNLPMKPK